MLAIAQLPDSVGAAALHAVVSGSGAFASVHTAGTGSGGGRLGRQLTDDIERQA